MEEMDVESEVDERFQKPNKYLSLLPHGQNVDEDADKFLDRVKTQLTKSVCMQDIKQGAKFWSGQLGR